MRFPVEDAWLINPDRPRRSRKKRKGATMARRRSRKRVSRRRRARRSTRTIVLKANPRRRRRHRSSFKKSRRRYRRNPGLGTILPTRGLVMDAVYVTGGFVGTKMLAGFVMPMIGVQQPIARIAVKGVLAGALGYVGRMVLGAQAGNFLMLGGLVETVNDAVQTYVTPFVPALAVSSYPELSNYVEGMDAYPDLSGIVHDDLKEQV